MAISPWGSTSSAKTARKPKKSMSTKGPAPKLSQSASHFSPTRTCPGAQAPQSTPIFLPVQMEPESASTPLSDTLPALMRRSPVGLNTGQETPSQHHPGRQR